MSATAGNDAMPSGMNGSAAAFGNDNNCALVRRRRRAARCLGGLPHVLVRSFAKHFDAAARAAEQTAANGAALACAPLGAKQTLSSQPMLNREPSSFAVAPPAHVRVSDRRRRHQ